MHLTCLSSGGLPGKLPMLAGESKIEIEWRQRYLSIDFLSQCRRERCDSTEKITQLTADTIRGSALTERAFKAVDSRD